jgi:L-ascorbate 6-phosphate lactonase
VRDLAVEIRQTEVPANTVAIWWLGQFSFVVKGAGRVLALDPYLSDYPGGAPRAYPPLIPPGDLAGVDLVFSTHDHIDHLDPWTLGPMATASPEALFVMPEACRPSVEGVLPHGRVVGTRADASLTLKGVEITPIPAAHEVLEEGGVGHACQGYILRLAGVTLCHTGDTVMYDGMIERLRAHRVDVLIAPINGRDYFRNRRDILGNFTVREAADLAAEAGVRLLIPAHWDLFPANTENPGHLFEYLARAHPEQPCHYMARAERFLYVSLR